MAQQFWLGTEDGPSGINLLDRGHITVLNRGFRAPAPADGLRERVVTVDLRLSGPTVGDWQAARAEIGRMLERIEAEADRIHRTAGVLSVTLDGETWTYIDVLRGSLDVTELLPRGRDAFATLTLTCLPLLRGDAVQAQNLLSSPTDPTAAAWTRTNVTVTAFAAVAPDGSLTAATLLETTATGAHEIVQQIAKAATAVQYTLSCYVKANGRTAAALYLADGSGANGVYGGYDLAGGTLLYPAGTAGSGWSGASAAITDAGDGWWRIALAGTSNTATTLRCYVQLHNGAGTAYAGDAAKGVRIWGAQVEEGAAAGLLLVPRMLPDTVREAYTETGYTYDTITMDFSKDSSNLLSGETWDESNLTEATGQSDPSGGTAASRHRDSSTVSTGRRIMSGSYATPTGLPAAYTGALYIKFDAGRNTPTVWLANGSSGPTTDSAVYFTIDLSTGALGSVSTSGAQVAFVSREVQDVGGGWWWVRITATLASGVNRVYMGCHPNGLASYAGNTSYGVYVWRPQVVAGSTIKKPVTTTTTTVDPVEHPAETLATGKLAGAHLYGIPGDASAVYRIEVDDESAGTAMDRLHIGAWSGDDVQLDQPGPFIVAEPAGEAVSLSDGDGYVGDSVATASISPTWQPIAQIPLDDLTGRRGLADLLARVRDRSPYLSPPASIRAEVDDAMTVRRLGRVASPARDSVTSLGLGRPLVTPGSTLVLLCQWTSGISAPSITLNGGGGSWTSRIGGDNGRVHVRWWTLENADQLTSGLSVSWSAGVTYAVATLLELSGVAAASYDTARIDTLSPRNGVAATSFTTGGITAGQATSMLLSLGIGTKYVNNPLTVVGTPSTYRTVSSLASGGVAVTSVSSVGPHTVTWERPLADAEPEGWIALLAAFKSATTSTANLTPGQWSLCMTAVGADGTESLPTGIVSVPVPSAGSSVHITGTAPLAGAAATYRHYRNRGSGWGYLETGSPAHIWTDEADVTPADPPTVSLPVAAWRASVALPSGATLWRAQASVPSAHANGVWEDVNLGTLPLPPIAAGEGDTPEGAVLVVEAAHLTGATVDVNGVWLYDSASGQARAWRDGLDATTTPDWVIDTNRDGVTSAWLRDTDGSDAGQPVVTGRLTLAPGNALLVIRPEVAGGVSDLVTADVRVSRVLVTPRWTYLRGRHS